MALIDKFHIIRKGIALVQLFFCIVVFTFSLILLIIGGVAHASAARTDTTFYQSTDYFSGASLLITSGLFGIIIAIIGAVGAIPCLFDRQDNWNLWIGLIVLIVYILVLVGIFIFEVAAGGWAYTQWDFVSGVLEGQLKQEVRLYYGAPGREPFTESVDYVHMNLECCGITSLDDWQGSEWDKLNSTKPMYLPHSCCPDPNNRTYNNNTMMYVPVPPPWNVTTGCPRMYAYSPLVGCWSQIRNILESYTLTIAGVAIALAILQLIITLIPIALLVILIVELRRSRSLELK